MHIVSRIKEAISGRNEGTMAWSARFFQGRRRSLARTVIDAVHANGGGDVGRLTPESRLREDVALTELQRVQLVMDVEKRFDLEISDGDAARITTIEHLVDWVESKVPGDDDVPSTMVADQKLTG